MVEVIRRGEIWVANLNPNRGREIGKIRPVLVIQSNELTAIGTDMVIILPMTTLVHRQFKHFRVNIQARDRLLQDAHIIVDQPRALDKSRFGEGPLTALTTEEMAVVERSLLAVMGMY
jgi:mRNA interferase MazF